MKLVIVESPSKTKTIKKYLGSGYEVMASKGHVVDLPKSKIGIDVASGFKPSYVVTNKKSLSALKSAFAKSDELILAVDLDREGEAIGWHVAVRLGAVTEGGRPKGKKPIKRITFSEISQKAIEEALQNPRDIDMNLVNAQQARRFLDRLVGYTLSPVLWKKISFGLSAGRVQSVALRLIVEREEERNKFKPEEYWTLGALTDLAPKANTKVVMHENTNEETVEDSTDSSLVRFELFKKDGKQIKISSKKQAQDALDNLKGQSLKILSLETKQSARYTKPPFVTSTLQQAAINLYGFTAKRTMSAAQKLYEKGFITYMRTDSVAMSQEAIELTRKFIKKSYSDKYLSEKVNYFKSKSKNSQEAHECIRPVKVETIDNKAFDADMSKIYKLIRNRAIASQMAPAKIESASIIALTDNGYEFKITGTRILFDGYLKLKTEKPAETVLPKLVEGQVLGINILSAEQHFTRPVARYSEATLIKKLEELEIGRPSTYSSIISTILSRKYVVKDGKYLMPTDTGNAVTSLLRKYFQNIVDYKFTSNMENDLDDIALGKLDWKKMLTDFFVPFEKEVHTNESGIKRDEFTFIGNAPGEIKCPECESPMLIKLGRFGRFYSCKRFPECKGMRSIEERSAEEEKEILDSIASFYDNAPKTDDGRDYLLKRGRFGFFWAHPDYPKVKDAKPLQIKKSKLKKVFGEIPKTDDGRDYLLRSGKYGKFWAHPDYPKVKDIKKARQIIKLPV